MGVKKWGAGMSEDEFVTRVLGSLDAAEMKDKKYLREFIVETYRRAKKPH